MVSLVLGDLVKIKGNLASRMYPRTFSQLRIICRVKLDIFYIKKEEIWTLNPISFISGLILDCKYAKSNFKKHCLL